VTGLRAEGKKLKLMHSVAVILLLLLPASAQQQADRLAQWLAAVAAHEPGNPGKAAVEVASWPGAEIESVIVEAKQHARTLGRTRRDEANDLLLRGAALHADIGRLIPDDMERRSPRQQRIYVVRDGRDLGTRFISIHWDLGRSLLDSVVPEPAAHPGVLLWYQQTAMDLMRLRSLAEASVHLPRGRRIFPTDPMLLFLSGILHERFSSSSLQAAAASVVAGNRAETSLGSEKAELTRAERFFRDALAVQPDHLEARVRYGHVLAALGRHELAAEALRAAIKSGVTGEWLYLAEMFLGAEEDVLGQRARARACFEHAASLYPRAQSPRIALSQLSRRAGDRAGAQRELRILAEIPANSREREDPWWDYYDIR
jgi:tetratricopeptide (TPR) repeat protein